jgi:hypothetical protein
MAAFDYGPRDRWEHRRIRCGGTCGDWYYLRSDEHTLVAYICPACAAKRDDEKAKRPHVPPTYPRDKHVSQRAWTKPRR